MRARFGIAVALLVFLLPACATDRSALHPVGVTPRTEADVAALGVRTSRSHAPATARVASVPSRARPAPSVPTRSMTAKALAGHMGLRYADEQNHVLLYDEMARVRIFKDSGNVMVAGHQETLPTRTQRKGRSLIVPAPMVQYVATKVEAQRKLFHDETIRDTPPHLVHSEPGAIPKPRARPQPKSIFDMPLATPVAPRPSSTTLAGDSLWSNHMQPARSWKWIVLHHSDDESGNLAKYDRLHRDVNHWDECGYHFVIGNGTLSGDGQIEVGGRWYKQKHGAHCKTCDNAYNEHGIGICLVGDFETGGRPSARQMDSLVRLCRWLAATYGVDESRIIGHCHAKATACPGKLFPWDEFHRRVAAR